MPEADATAAAEAGDGGSGCSPRLGCYGFMAVNILMGLYCTIAYAVSATVAGAVAVAVAVALLLLALAGRLAQTAGGSGASSGRLLSCPCACGLMAGAGIGVLPAFAYEPDGGGGEARGSASGAHMCAVCLEDVRAGEMVRRLPACGHLFHEDCVDVWLRVRRTCPLCRRVLPRRKPAAAAAATASSAAVLPPV